VRSSQAIVFLARIVILSHAAEHQRLFFRPANRQSTLPRVAAGIISPSAGVYMRAHVDDIIAFSGIEPFIDAPLRTYSTGMVARLAFAVATSIEAETILLDEILAVGDAAFRRQCYARIERFVSSGGRVVVVSHDLEPLDMADVISRYRRSFANA
jgi:ABC-type multidrug transport system ATPase subunit